MNCRSIGVFVVLLALVAIGRVCADDDEPSFQGKPFSAWVRMLNGGAEQPGRMLAPHLAGTAVAHPALWRGPVNHRRAGLLAIELIGPLKSRQAIPAIATALRDDPAEIVRRGAAQALGRMCAKARQEKLRFDAGRDALIVAIRRDSAGPVREASASALGRLEDDARPAIPALAAALGDPHEGTRTAAAETLRRLGKEAREALPELIGLLRDRKQKPLARMQVAFALGRIGGGDAVVALGAVTGSADDSIDVRRAAAEALGMCGKEASSQASALATALRDRAATVGLRRAAAGALDQLGPDASVAVPTLLEALKDNDRFVRCLAMHALGRVGPALGTQTHPTVTALLAGLSDGVAEVRVAAVEALGTLGPVLGDDLPAVRGRLMEASRDSQKAVREAAAGALKKL